MRSRSPRQPQVDRSHPVDLPPRLRVSVKAAAAVLGFSEQAVIESGIVLICTYVLNRILPEIEGLEKAGKEVPKWVPEELQKALASSFVSKRKSRVGLKGSRGQAGSPLPITSVGSVLRSWRGGRGK